MPSFTFDVFISYSHHDADWVRRWLLPRLEAAGLRVCIDFRDFEVGTPSIINMEQAAQRSAKTLLVLTPAWVQSEWTSFESLLIQTKDPAGARRRLLPLMLETCTPPDRLGIFTYADFTVPANRESELTRLVNSIGESVRASERRHALQPNLVHPYPLQANFTGRVVERRELSGWLADDELPICALVAMGGMGKSALAWYWLKHELLARAPGDAASDIEGVMWWSFYEGESSFTKFIDDSLRYVGGQPIDATRLPTTYDRAQELRQLLQARRILFVLDGFERQLRAYARLDAAYRPDDLVEPPHEERACVDPIAARWLNSIAAGTTRAKVLLTTRLMPRDLEDRAGDALAGVRKRELKELPRDDAVAFMSIQGVTKGTPAEIAGVCAEYGNHPLSLRLLSGLIARDTRMPGDIAAAPRHDVHADLVQRQHHVLEQSYDALPKRERALLSRIAAFRSPMTYDALLIFNEFGDEAKFDDALDNLQARGLLQRDTARNRYDLHPIVRHYAYERLTDKTGVHIRLRDYFAEIPAPDKVDSLEDLMPVIELYHHTVRAGLYDEAADLYYERIRQAIYYRFGAYQTHIELLRALFPNGEVNPPRLTDELEQAWALNAIAIAYGVSGQPRRAVLLKERANSLYEKASRKTSIARVMVSIAFDYVMLGELRSAERNLRRSIDLGREINDKFVEAVSHQELGQLLIYRGAFDDAEKEFDEGIKLHVNTPAGQWSQGSSWLYRAQSQLLQRKISQATELAREAKRLKDIEYPGVGKVERDVIIAEWLLGAALTMEGKDLNVAASHLTEALTRCRRINLVEAEPDILLEWARWHRARGNAQEAWAHAEEARAIADRCEYRLKQAGIHNFLARITADAGDGVGARRHAETARERAWCDGPPYCYKPALDEAEGMLKELAAKGE